MKPTVGYMGFKNAQTWCVCTAFKNDQALHDAVVLIIRRERSSHVVCDTLLRALAARQMNAVTSAAPWAWNDGQTLSDVSWREVRQEFLERYVTA